MHPSGTVYLHVYLGILQGYMVLSQNENLPVLTGPVLRAVAETSGNNNALFFCVVKESGVKCAPQGRNYGSPTIIKHVEIFDNHELRDAGAMRDAANFWQ